MVTETIVVAHSLNEIVKFNVRALIRRFHLNRDWIIGFIGERGSGKSIGGANVSIRDFMMNDEPCWSNMRMKLSVDVSDEWANRFGIAQGGRVLYEAEKLEKQEFLRLDSRYEGGCIFLDEPNIEYGEARRSNTNTNLATDTAVQELRKLQCGLVYAVINEMYVDVRIRENTDIFISCKDVALNPQNLNAKMKQGHVFEWYLFPMTARFAGNGNTFKDTHKPVGPVQITMRDMWGSIDTYERQLRDGKYSEMKQLMPVEMIENPEAVKEKDRWSWLYKKIEEFYAKHAKDGEFIEINSNDFRREIGVQTPQAWGSVVSKIRELIPGITARGKGSFVNPTVYTVPNRILIS